MSCGWNVKISSPWASGAWGPQKFNWDNRAFQRNLSSPVAKKGLGYNTPKLSELSGSTFHALNGPELYTTVTLLQWYPLYVAIWFFWSQDKAQRYPLPRSVITPCERGGKLFYLQLELFCLLLSFFAYSLSRPLLDALYHCTQKSSNCKQKNQKL